MYTVYAIYNKKHKKFYRGQTENLERRLEQHNSKTFGGYTSSVLTDYGLSSTLKKLFRALKL